MCRRRMVQQGWRKFLLSHKHRLTHQVQHPACAFQPNWLVKLKLTRSRFVSSTRSAPCDEAYCGSKPTRNNLPHGLYTAVLPFGICAVFGKIILLVTSLRAKGLSLRSADNQAKSGFSAYAVYAENSVFHGDALLLSGPVVFVGSNPAVKPIHLLWPAYFR